MNQRMGLDIKDCTLQELNKRLGELEKDMNDTKYKVKVTLR